MLPALSPTQTVPSSDGSRSASPDSRIQWHRYRASPPEARRTSVSRTRGTQRSSSMLGSAVSSSTPKDFQPSSHIGQLGSCPLMNCHALSPGPTQGCPYIAVGMQRALDSPTGLPSRSTSASWMLAFLMPADVSRSFKLPPLRCRRERSGRVRTRTRLRLADEQELIASGQVQRPLSPPRPTCARGTTTSGTERRSPRGATRCRSGPRRPRPGCGCRSGASSGCSRCGS